MKRARITLITSSLTCGGAEKNVALLANEWAKRGRSVSVISFDRHPPFFQLDSAVHLVSTDITRGYRQLWKDFWTTPHRLWRLRKVILETRPDVVISFMDINNLLTLLSARGLPIPIIVAERSDPAIWPIPHGWRMLRRALYPFASKVITQTEEAKAFFSKNLQRKIMVIPNPVPAFPDPLNLPEKLNSKKIVSVGRLVSIKRFDLLLGAMAELRSEFPDWHLDILGDGEERNALEEMTRRLDLSNVVEWRGTVKDTRPFLQNAALFVLCSDFEGFPNALSEALAAGIPAVCTDTQGVRALLRDRQNGISVPRGDQKGLVLGMGALMQNSELRIQMSRQALRVSEDFSMEKVLTRWNEALESV